MKIYVKFNDGFSLGKGNLFFCSLLLLHRSQQPAEPFCFTGARGIYDGLLKQNRILLLIFAKLKLFYTIYGRQKCLGFFLISSTSVRVTFPLFPTGLRRWRLFRKSGKQHKKKATLLPRAARERGSFFHSHK